MIRRIDAIPVASLSDDWDGSIALTSK